MFFGRGEFPSFKFTLSFNYDINKIQSKTMIAQPFKNFLSELCPQLNLHQITNYAKLVSQLFAIQQTCPKEFTTHMPTYIEAIEHCIGATIEEKQELIEVAIECIKLFPEYFLSNPTIVQKILTFLISIMIDVPLQVPEKWYDHEPSNFDDEEIDPADYVKGLFTDQIEQISQVIGPKAFIKKYGHKLLCYYQTNYNDWRCKTVILGIVSQTCSSKVSLSNIISFAQEALKAAYDEHPKVRMEAADTLTIFSSALYPDFQEKFHQQCLPLFMNKIHDPIPKVASHWIICLSIFIKHWQQPTLLSPYVDEFLQKIEGLLLKENSYKGIKEDILQVLQSLASVNSLLNQQTIQRMFEICEVFFTNTVADEEDSEAQSNNLKILFMTSLVMNQPYPLIQNFVHPVVQTLSNLSDKLSPQKFLYGWQMVCSIQKKFEGWQTIYQKVQDIAIKYCYQTGQQSQQQSYKIALLSINKTVHCFGEEFHIFSTAIINKLKVLMSQTANKAIVYVIFETICSIMCQGKPTNPEQGWKCTVLQTITVLLDQMTSMYKYGQYNVFSCLLKAFKQVLSEYGILMNPVKLEGLFVNLIDSRKIITNKRDSLLIAMGDLEDQILNKHNLLDVCELLKKKREQQMLINSLNQTQISIAGTLKPILTILKGNHENFDHKLCFLLKYLNWVMQKAQKQMDKISNDVLAKQSNSYDLQYMILITNQIVKIIQFEGIDLKWVQLEAFLKNFCLHPEAQVRQAAVSGLNCFIQKTPHNYATISIIRKWKQTLLKGKKIPHAGEKLQQYGQCYDNVVAAIGSLIKFHGDYFEEQINPLFDEWLHDLPLNKIQNQAQITLLMDIALKRPEKIMDTGGNLRRFIRISGEILSNNLQQISQAKNRVILRQIKTVIKIMAQWPSFKQNREELLNTLEDRQKLYLNNLLETDLYTYE